MRDAVRDLSHDHAELNRRVLAVGAKLEMLRRGTQVDLAPALDELREMLFLHFAREEEGLFPFVTDAAPTLAVQVQEMAVAHDTICGSLSRACHLARSGAEVGSLAALYERFENAYADHARREADLLSRLDELLDADHREQLAALVDGL
ncbi:MAG: hemerythrin domain-containing protein [Kofleriaceae bacterium]|nr:hemerythrin domain-containing protein [Kofleriaceae bacterium]